MNKQSIRDIDVSGKRVFLRVDYNVQFDNGTILDDIRLRESISRRSFRLCLAVTRFVSLRTE